MLSAQDVAQIPWGLLIAAFVMVGGGLLSWGAYVMKQLVEHAKWMAVATEKFDHALNVAEENGERLDQVRAEQERVRLELAALARVRPTH